jgi:integrase
LRLSELLGLTWGDIDFSAGVIRVGFQMGRDGNRRRLKTAAARRDVILMSRSRSMTRSGVVGGLASWWASPARTRR